MTEKRYKKLHTAAELNGLMEGHYRQVKLFRFGKPLAWVTSGTPVEILRAMDILPVYPENYGALCGARGDGASMCQFMEARGYAADLCAYAKESLATILDPKEAPLGGLPRPDLLVCCTNICNTVLKWYEAVARHYGTPLFVLDAPYIHEDEGPAPQVALDYVRGQVEDLIAWLEERTHRTLKLEKLRQAAALSSETTRLWREIRELCKARPSPLNAPDLFVNMAPVVTLRGTKEAVDFYRKLKAEVEERVAQGVGAIPHERYRLLWDNIAIWPKLYRFYSLFVDQDACFVVDTYTGGWAMTMDGGDLLTAIARTYTEVFLNQSLRFRAARMTEMVRDFGVDGFVMHSNRSCKPYSLGQYDIRRIVSEATGVPGLVIEADHCDARAYSEEAIKNRVQAFMETLAAER
jgi:benzoyl-CoA reductase/2-hydroxyglutaryl-CoA dehydratase subunit BcrC/BadD/HgdB